jgi:hypothetical protein
VIWNKKRRVSTSTTFIHGTRNPNLNNHARKGNKRHQIGKQKAQFSLLADEKFIDSTKTLLELIKKFCKAAEYKINLQKSLPLLYDNSKISEKIKKAIPITIVT